MDRARACTFVLVMALGYLASASARAEDRPLEAAVRERAAAVEDKVIRWRRDIHQHPELGDREKRTAALVAEHLEGLGIEVRKGVARTGVVGVLRGGKPGRTVALRADMDALPVTEPEGLPFASVNEGVMHACGHDAHTAMLMGAAEVLAGMKADIPGTVVFLFQPAEEGSSVVDPFSGKSWGAKLMLEEGAFKDPRPDAVFALHVMPGPLGQISFRSGATTAGSDTLSIAVTGKQGHGGMPWNTVDPIVTSAQIILGLQTTVSRRADLTASPAVVTVGTVQGGSSANVVPETVRMTGTIRTYDEAVRAKLLDDVALAAEKIAESAGAEADVRITPNYGTTINDPALTARMTPLLKRVSDGNVAEAALTGASEDFSFFAAEAPGLYVFLGITPRDQDPAKAAPNHNPRFFVDETALVIGTRALASLAVDFLSGEPPAPAMPAQTRPFVQEGH